MLKASIKNFQSIADLDVEVEGFTVVVGKTNIGKSSIIRSIKGVLENTEGDYFIREGESHTEVELDCPEMNVIWRKGAGKNDYEFPREDVLLQKVGRGVPPQIKEAGFRKLKAGRDELSVQVADQFDPIFLLDETGGTAAEVLCDVGRLGEVQEALSEAESDLRSTNDRLRLRREDLEEVDEELSFFDGLEDSLATVREASARRDDLRESKRELDELERLSSVSSELKSDLGRFESILDVRLPTEDPGESVERLSELVDMDSERKRVVPVIERTRALSEVEVPDEIPEGKLRELSWLINMIDKRDEVVSDLESVSDVADVSIPEGSPEMGELPELVKMDRFRRELVEEVDARSGVSDVQLPDPSGLEDLSEELKEFSSTLTQVEEAAEEIRSSRAEIERLDDEIEAANQEIEKLFVQAGSCPMCERSM